MPIKKEREYRNANGFTIPEGEGNELVLRGAPVVFNTPTVIAEWDGVKYYEVIDSRAFEDADMRDFVFNYNHSGSVFARTRNGTLTHEITATQMNVVAKLMPEDQRHQELYRDVKSGLIDKMSFSFTVEEENVNVETRTRTITKIKKLYDVSAVDIPAYNDTSIAARSEGGATLPEWINGQGQDLARRKKILTILTQL
jgi:Phage head maturation protease